MAFCGFVFRQKEGIPQGSRKGVLRAESSASADAGDTDFDSGDCDNDYESIYAGVFLYVHYYIVVGHPDDLYLLEV